jgi:hypothetical protein
VGHGAIVKKSFRFLCVRRKSHGWTIQPGLAQPESYLTRVEQMKRYDGLVLAQQRASRDCRTNFVLIER